MPFLNKLAITFIGSIIFAVGIDFFLVPFHLLDGGIIGIGLIITYLWGFKTGLAILFCSIPIFIIAWFHYRTYFYNSLHGMLISSFCIDLLSPYQVPVLNTIKLSPLISSLLGGVLVGIGIGIMLKFETSTGGTDLLAQFISSQTSINVGLMIFMIDLIVVCLGGLFISSETFYLSLITIIIVGITTSFCVWIPIRIDPYKYIP